MSRGDSQALARAVQKRFGVRLRPELHGLLDRAAAELLQGSAAASLTEVARRVETAGDADPVVERMRGAASIQETWFMRGRAQLEALVKRVGLKKELRIWSAACATGEEAYSVAALFRRTGARVSVLGSDMNGAALQKAREGRYSGRAFREADPAALADVVTAEGRVRDELRRCVTFVQHNLVTDPPLKVPPFDVVLCRNVLIYFDAATLPKVVGRLTAALKPGGVLALTSAEAPAAAGLRSLGRALFAVEPPVAPPAPATSRAVSQAAPRVEPGPVDPSPPPADFLAEARAAADAQRYPEALALLEQAATRQPDGADAFLLRSSVLLATGDAKGALAQARRALFLERSSAAAELALAQALVRDGQAAKARSHFLRALKLLEHVDDAAPVPGLDDTAGAVRALVATALEGTA
jgi:chemotaxis methyl-accepting protein methylase